MPGQWTEGRTKTFRASTALAKHRRVRLDNNGELAYCSDSSTDCIGTLTRDALAADDNVAIHCASAEGTQVFVASEAINAGAACYAATNGRVAATGTVLVGEALEAAGADGDYVEVMPSAAAILGSTARSSLTQDDLKPYPIPLTAFRVHDAMQTNLPGTAATDDLAIIGGTFGTAAPTIQGVDFGGTNTTAYARCQQPLPAEYVDGQTVTLRVRAAMLTTVADTSAALDAAVHKQDGDGAVGSDICATAAQDMNDLTPADYDFTITPTGLVAGDMLDIRLSFAGVDAGNLGVMIPEISEVTLLCDVKG